MVNKSRKTPSNSHDIKGRSGIRWSILFHMAWSNIINKKLRSALTVTGVIIGIGSIFFLLSFGLGIQDLVTKQIIGNQTIKTVVVSTTNSRIVKLDKDIVKKMTSLPHVQESGLVYSFPGSLSQKGSAVDTVAYGVDMHYQDMVALKIIDGRLLTQQDNKSVLINDSAAKAIGFKNPKDAVGKKINLTVPLQDAGAKKDSFENNYTVVGLVSTGAGSEVYIPSFHFDLAGVPAYSEVQLLVDNTNNIPNLRKQVESMGFQTTSPSDTIDQVNQIFSLFNLVLVGFGSVSMVVAVLGMFNTLTISLLERTKEIGLMMAMGGRNRDMSRLFIIEALLLSVMGAATGIGLAVIIGQIVNTVLVTFARQRGVETAFQLFATPPWLILSLIGFMGLVGLVVAILPARRAHRINPIDALRRE
ncbi:MAG: ABC transporter permease [Candidatus Nomurabacteria bacterium]|nr:MAG: ABC transporter permease [Candidatus Nomurabacteria bacterium]